MRTLRSLLHVVPAVVLFVVLAIFVVENIRTERYTFLGNTITGNVWWVVTAAALLGFLAAVTLLVPGRVVVGWRSRRLGREAGRREQELTTVRAQNAQHVAELSQVTAERDHGRDQQPAPVDAQAGRPLAPAGDVSRHAADEGATRHPVGTFQSRLHGLMYRQPAPRTPGHVPADPMRARPQSPAIPPAIPADRASTGKQTPTASA